MRTFNMGERYPNELQQGNRRILAIAAIAKLRTKGVVTDVIGPSQTFVLSAGKVWKKSVGRACDRQ